MLNTSQRIILVASEFHHEVASAVLWLRDYQIDIKCVRLRAFADKVDDLYVIPDIIIPLPETKDYTEKREKKQLASKQAYKSRFSMDPGDYEDKELKKRLLETLQYESPLTPRFRAFLEIILKEDRKFSRDELVKLLHQKGIGDDEGQTGTYMSNISQMLTRKQNDHLRQLIDFDSDGGVGSQKNNYYLEPEYRVLTEDVLKELTATQNSNYPDEQP